VTMAGLVLPLAHAGEGATWQALLTLLALGLLVVAVLALFGVVTIEEPGDLILPLAGVAVLASLSGATSTVLSDWVGWAFPVGVVVLVALVLTSLTALDLSPTSPLLWGTVVLAVVGAVVLQGPIVRAWHPTDVGLANALLDDLAVEILAPEPEATVPTGTVEVVVEASGGTLGEGFVDAAGTVPEDPEEQVGLTLTVVSLESGENTSQVGDPVEDCSDGCDRATYEVTIDEPGQWTIFVEAKTADTRAFTTTSGSSGTPTASVTVTAE
jgi:hypothetical protein